jgi:hypothetical protein
MTPLWWIIIGGISGVELTPISDMLLRSSDVTTDPSDWKTTIVAPVFKKGDRGQPSNYRPISLTSICCKIMEHIIHSSVLTHLENTNILSDELALPLLFPFD